MQAVREVGGWRIVRFALYEPLMTLFRLLPYPPLRKAMLLLLGARIAPGVVLQRFTLINHYRRGFGGLVIGPRSFVGDECLLDLAEAVTLEAEVTLAARAVVLTHLNVGYRDHPLQAHFPSSTGPVVFRRGCFVGSHATILPGVTVGECAFVAAGSLVAQDVPPRTLVAGVPAKAIRSWT